LRPSLRFPIEKSDAFTAELCEYDVRVASILFPRELSSLADSLLCVENAGPAPGDAVGLSAAAENTVSQREQ
jgi:hypothetical protein